MKRLEVIGNKSIEEDLFDALEKNNVVFHYTKIPVVHGQGTSDPKMGDGTWPEENFILIIYCESDIAQKIFIVVKELKKYFPNEGIKVFEMQVDCCL